MRNSTTFFDMKPGDIEATKAAAGSRPGRDGLEPDQDRQDVIPAESRFAARASRRLADFSHADTETEPYVNRRPFFHHFPPPLWWMSVSGGELSPWKS